MTNLTQKTGQQIPDLRPRVWPRSIFRWFTSRTVRRASDLGRQVWRLRNEQRDLLSDDAIQALIAAEAKLKATIDSGADRSAIEESVAHLEDVANERLLPYPQASIRENTKEILVAITVIFAFTTFFLQLTKIPTNSLVPTLYGITSQDLRGDRDFKIPNPVQRFFEYWIYGVSYHHIVAKTDGALEEFEPPRRILPFVKQQRFRVGSEWYTVWFPPDRFDDRAGLLRSDLYFHKGDDIVKLRVVAGDHLLVDRISYNFRRPKRGEIFVFKTKGIAKLEPGMLYIKRLVALGGDHVRIGNDQHLIINGKRLDASTPHFENVYTFRSVPKENHYFGHVNDFVARRYGRSLAPLFPDENTEHVVEPNHYLALGDNTMNSYDSRAWGDVPCQNVIGKCWFVYWPFTKRFGWGTR